LDVIAVLASCAEGEVVLVGSGLLRVKELG